MKVITCPRCYAEFTSGPGACPECGVRLLRSISGVVKTSAVMICAGGQQGFYRSVDDVPQPLRSRLREVTNGSNAGTIVIADRAGKEQIAQGMAVQENAGQSASGSQRYPWILWAAAFLMLMAAAVISAAFMAR